MSTGNHVIVVLDHSAKKYAGIVRKLLEEYQEAVVSVRGRHFTRFAEVMRLVRPDVRVRRSYFTFADRAPELTVNLVPARSGRMSKPQESVAEGGKE